MGVDNPGRGVNGCTVDRLCPTRHSVNSVCDPEKLPCGNSICA